MGEVQELEDPVDHRVAERDQGVDAAEREAVDELLDEEVHRDAAVTAAVRPLGAPHGSRAAVGLLNQLELAVLDLEDEERRVVDVAVLGERDRLARGSSLGGWSCRISLEHCFPARRPPVLADGWSSQSMTTVPPRRWAGRRCRSRRTRSWNASASSCVFGDALDVGRERGDVGAVDREVVGREEAVGAEDDRVLPCSAICLPKSWRVGGDLPGQEDHVRVVRDRRHERGEVRLLLAHRLACHGRRRRPRGPLAVASARPVE